MPRFVLGLFAFACAVFGSATARCDEAPRTPEGYRSLFNGNDLTGWHGFATLDPRAFAAMSAEEQAAKLKTDTADAMQHWSVSEGDLVNDGYGAYLTTDEEFEDYELLIEYRTVPKADSGIYLKGTPQVQIWDFTDPEKFPLGANLGSGGLWNNPPGSPGKDPFSLMDHPLGEWNTFRIQQIGSRTSVTLNGTLIVDHAIMGNYWTLNDPKFREEWFTKRQNQAAPLFRKGPIQLQTHGGEIRWRNIAIRTYTPEEATKILAEKAAHSDDVPLFNGKDLTGWTGAVDSYEVVDGMLRCRQGAGGVLYSKDEFTDFVATVEFRLPPAGNNGLAIRYGGEGNPAYAGMTELQILDNEAADYANLDERQYHGSSYGMVPAHRGYLRPTGEWNFQQVTVKGTTLLVELNGYEILKTDISGIDSFMSDTPHPGKTRTSGSFGFAGHSDPVEFRRVVIRPLKE